MHPTHCSDLDLQQDNASVLPRDTWMPWQFQPREMMKWKSTGPRRDSGNIILDHFQFQLPVSSPYVAKSLKGGPDVIWICLANFISKALLKSFSFHMLNTIALVQSHILLICSNTRPSKLVPLTPTYLYLPPWNCPYMHSSHCSQSDLPNTHTWSFHSKILKGSEFIHYVYCPVPAKQKDNLLCGRGYSPMIHVIRG